MCIINHNVTVKELKSWSLNQFLEAVKKFKLAKQIKSITKPMTALEVERFCEQLRMFN